MWVWNWHWDCAPESSPPASPLDDGCGSCNTSISIRILSPGDDGPVSQENSVTSASIVESLFSAEQSAAQAIVPALAKVISTPVVSTPVVSSPILSSPVLPSPVLPSPVVPSLLAPVPSVGQAVPLELWSPPAAIAATAATTPPTTQASDDPAEPQGTAPAGYDEPHAAVPAPDSSASKPKPAASSRDINAISATSQMSTARPADVKPKRAIATSIHFPVLHGLRTVSMPPLAFAPRAAVAPSSPSIPWSPPAVLPSPAPTTSATGAAAGTASKPAPGAPLPLVPHAPRLPADSSSNLSATSSGSGSSLSTNATAAIVGALLFLASGLTQWLWAGAERRPRGLRAGRPERPG